MVEIIVEAIDKASGVLANIEQAFTGVNSSADTGKMLEWSGQLEKAAQTAGLAEREILKMSYATGTMSDEQYLAAATSERIKDKAKELAEAVKSGAMTTRDAGKAFREYAEAQLPVKTNSDKIADAIGSLMPIFAAAGAAAVAFSVESINATVAYADEVRKLQQITGASAEETSKLIQIAGDYKVSTQALTAAQRALAKDGVTLTTAALADLADQFNALQPGAERSAFLMDKFGRSGLQMAELMEQGGDSIRQMSDEMTGSLVMTEANIKAARNYEMALDNMNQKVEELQTSIGNELIPVLTALMSTATDDAMFQLAKDMGSSTVAAREFVRTIRELNKAPIDSATQSYTAMAQALSTQVSPAIQQTTEDANAMAQAISDNNASLLAGVQQYASEYTAYETQIRDIQQQRIQAQQDFDSLTWWEQQSTGAQALSEKLTSLTAKELELKNAIQQSAAESIYARTEQKLAVDGLTDAETDYLLEVKKGLGLATQEQIDAVRKQIQEADKLALAFEESQKRKTDAEKGHFVTSAAEWEAYTNNVDAQVSTNIDRINAYIETLGQIPTNITTNIVTGLPNEMGTTGAAGNNVTYYIQNAYIGADNAITAQVV